jgi:hypothetical protein
MRALAGEAGALVPVGLLQDAPWVFSFASSMDGCMSASCRYYSFHFFSHASAWRERLCCYQTTRPMVDLHAVVSLVWRD